MRSPGCYGKLSHYLQGFKNIQGDSPWYKTISLHPICLRVFTMSHMVGFLASTESWSLSPKTNSDFTAETRPFDPKRKADRLPDVINLQGRNLAFQGLGV